MNYEELQNHDKSTTPIHADEVRRTYTSERLQEVIANAELDASALEGRSEQGAYRYKPSVLQTVVATILCAIPLIHYVSEAFMYELIYEYYRIFRDYISDSLFIIGFILLAYKANNKATRIALGTLVFLQIYYLFLNIGFGIIVFDARIPLNNFKQLLNYCEVLTGLSTIYCYWLIIENNRLSQKSRAWINFIAVIYIIGLFETVWNPNIRRITFDDPDDSIARWIYNATGNDSCRGYDWNIVSYYFNILLDVFLRAIAYWHFARCEAFAGKYDANAKCNYSPLNKWIAAAIIVPVIMAICLFLLYKNYELFI